MRYLLAVAFAAVATVSFGQGVQPVPEKTPTWEDARAVATDLRNVIEKSDIETSDPRARMQKVAALERRVKQVFGGDMQSPKFFGCHQAVQWLGTLVSEQNTMVVAGKIAPNSIRALTRYAVEFGDAWRYCRNAVNALDAAPVKK